MARLDRRASVVAPPSLCEGPFLLADLRFDEDSRGAFFELFPREELQSGTELLERGRLLNALCGRRRRSRRERGPGRRARRRRLSCWGRLGLYVSGGLEPAVVPGSAECSRTRNRPQASTVVRLPLAGRRGTCPPGSLSRFTFPAYSSGLRARLGCTRMGSPGILGNSGGKGISP